MRDRINYYVKFREDFLLLAPSMLEEYASEYLVNGCSSPFMTITFPVQKKKQQVIPAVTHVDGTCRAQTVTATSNPRYYSLIQRFAEITGVPVILNTSLNVKGDPIAMKPEDAIAHFLFDRSGLLSYWGFYCRKRVVPPRIRVPIVCENSKPGNPPSESRVPPGYG